MTSKRESANVKYIPCPTQHSVNRLESDPFQTNWKQISEILDGLLVQ